jgi:DNA-binding response OmpR family regulator
LERGPLKMDFGKRRVYWQEQEVELTEREFAMLELLALYPERIFAAQELLERFFPEADSGPHVVRVYVSQLRHKTAPELILTVPGGYRLGAS